MLEKRNGSEYFQRHFCVGSDETEGYAQAQREDILRWKQDYKMRCFIVTLNEGRMNEEGFAR